MRILHTIRSVDPRGGGVITAVLSLAKASESLGHTVEIASLDLPGDEWVGKCPVLVHALGVSAGKYGYSPKYSTWIRDQAPRFGAVVINGLWLFNGYGAWRALRGVGTPYYVFPHGMLDPWFKRAYPLKHLKKWLYWPWAEYRVLRDARAVLFTSEEERRSARESFWLYRCREEIVPLGMPPPPPGVEEQKEVFLKRFPGLENTRRLLFLGRLHEKKGCDLLLRSFSKLAPRQPGLRLIMAGPGPNGALEAFQRMADDFGLKDRVVWTGMLEGPEKWGAFRSAEVFILPSHQENFGLAVAEALACGTPVVISNKVNIWREISESGAGLVGEDDQSGVDELLRDWLALSETSRAEMGGKALSCFQKYFHMDCLLRRLGQLFGGAEGSAAPGSKPWQP